MSYNISRNLNRRPLLVGLISLLIILALGLSACGEEITPLPPSPTAAPPQATPAPTTGPELTPTPTAADPEQALSAAKTVPNFTATPLPVTPTTVWFYGPISTPPRTLDPKAEMLPTVTPPRPLAKGSLVVGSAGGLYLMDLQGGNERLLAAGATFSEPKVSPDGLRVAAFRTDRLTRLSQLALVDTNGGLKIISPDNGGVFLSAAWSPDSKTLALTRATDSNADGTADEYDSTTVVLYDVASGRQQAIGEGRYPAWSPDGVRLAFVVAGPAGDDIDPATRQLRRGPNSLAVYNVAGKARRVLLESKGMALTLGAAAFSPVPPGQKLDLRYFKAATWHPDSKHIVATADLTGPNGLRAGVVLSVTLDDTTPKVISAAGDAAGRVAWGADGKRLAFETQPQYPVGPKSAAMIALLNEASPEQTSPPTVLLGNPANRSEGRSPGWLAGGQLAYLEGDRSVLTLVDLENQKTNRLFSECTGFDWY